VHRKILFSLAAAAFFLAALNLSAQGTAIFYQGRLNVSGSPANTNYDFRFAVYDAVTNGNRVSISVTNAAVPVSNGLFTVTLDFGPGVFNGTANGSNDWMDIGVRAIGVASFTTLVPRQPILPVPYALFATAASNLLGSLQSTQIVGKISSGLLSGTYSNGVNFSNGTNIFAGSFSGNGGNLTNLNASQIASGTLADARLSANVPLFNANQTFTGSNIFNGGIALNGPNTLNGPGTFTGANSFSGINTFANLGNSFSGSFFGNGLVGWAPVNGTTTNAVSDHGYLLLNSGLTTVTLPASPSVDDIVRVSGGGGGGWLVKENSGQSITGNFAAYTNAQLVTLSVGDYYDVAATADAVRMYAVGNSVNGITGVIGSTDGGHNWPISVGLLSGSWNSVACSANGKIIYAQPTSGTIQKFDSSLIWTTTGVSATGTAIACTANGATLITGNNVACSGNGTYRAQLSGGVIQVSNNGGSSWSNVANAPAAGVTCLAASSDCTRLVAGVNNGLLYASSNQGQSWTTLTTTNQAWSGAWMSPDGSKFAATVSTASGITGGIYYCDVSALPNTSTTTSTGSLCGSQGSAVELQYIGGGQFMPVSSTGLLWAN
jgi:hypothetical protein